MKRLVVGALALAAVGALVGRSTAASSSQPIAIKLPKHVFGHTKVPDGGRVVDARWGKGPGRVGFVKAEYGPTGGSSFDVLFSFVCILDQHNGRVLVFDPNKPGSPPKAIPLVVNGTAGAVFRGVESSLAVDAQGRIYVLEPTDSAHQHPILYSFSPKGGAPLARVATAGSNPIVRTDGKAVYVSQLLSGPWQQAMVAGKPKHGPVTQYRDFGDGVHVLLQPNFNKPGFKQPIEVTLFRGNGSSTSWSVTSPDHVSPVDVEPFGNNLVLVLLVSTDKAQEYEVLDLGKHGLVNSYSVPYDHYAESALFDDFRLSGYLYHRGSTKKGIYVDSYRP